MSWLQAAWRKMQQGYPPGVCKAIIKGIMRELEERGINRPGEIGMHAVADDNDVQKSTKSPENGYSGKYKDDISGQLLNDAMGKEARQVELRYSKSKGVWVKVPGQRAFARTGRPPISVGWVDVIRETISIPDIAPGEWRGR